VKEITWQFDDMIWEAKGVEVLVGVLKGFKKATSGTQYTKKRNSILIPISIELFSLFYKSPACD
jgi:hypothetical protein